MNNNKRRIEFLLGLYEMGGGNPLQEVESKRLAEKLGMEDREFSGIGLYLKEEGFIGYFSFTLIHITHEGRKEAERIMAESYSQKERRVLEAIQDMGRMSNLIVYQDLAKRLGMSYGELGPICNGLDEQGFIDFPGGDLIQMKAAGHHALEPPKPSTPINVLSIGNNYGAAAVGSHINQSVTLTNDADFDNAIKNLVGLVLSSNLKPHEKEDLVEEVVKVNKLALRAFSPGPNP